LASGREHLGFKDGISQLGVRGRLSTNPDVFVTHRTLPLDFDPIPAEPAFSAPGQPLILPGEFVLGYARQSDAFGRRSASAWPLGPDPTGIITQPSARFGRGMGHILFIGACGRMYPHSISFLRDRSISCRLWPVSNISFVNSSGLCWSGVGQVVHQFCGLRRPKTRS
jgi:hypothetical protein